MFLGIWKDIEGMKADFWPEADYYYYNAGGIPRYAGELDSARVLLACYSHEDYEGDAFVLFERDGKLFEVNGSHCSCYGLEGQWEPEETSVDALRHRIANGELGAARRYGKTLRSRSDELRQVLDQFTKESTT